MVLKRIITKNIQNHREVVIDLPAKGLVMFLGDNSNGKSVIRKVTHALITGEIADPHERASLVNRKSVSGEVEYIRDDDTILRCHIQAEASATYIELQRPGSEAIRRYLSDKSYKALIREFGWHYDDNLDLALQVVRANEELLSYNTSATKNGRVLASALTDESAETAMLKLEDTIKETTKYRDGYNAQITAKMQTLNGLRIEDVEPLRVKLLTLQRLYRNLSSIYFPTIPEIHAVPDVKLQSLYTPTLPKVRYPAVYTVTCNIPDILSLARDLKSLTDMKCPTCGRRFVEHDSETLICS